jgi:hypothetical protein
VLGMSCFITDNHISSLKAGGVSVCLGWKSLPQEIVKLIFAYLDPDSLLMVETVNWDCKRTVQKYDDDLWGELVRALWRNVVFNRPNEVNVLQRIKTLPLTILKHNLIHIDLKRCIEKQDYQRMLLAKLVFHEKMQKEVSGENPFYKGKYCSQFYPSWSLTIPIYKASYTFTAKELRRTEIYASELCAIRWEFNFKHQAFGNEDADRYHEYF